MIVVADTSPLNYLVLLGCPDILHEIHGHILVPPAVLLEMRHLAAPPNVRSWALAPPDWIVEVPVRRLGHKLNGGAGRWRTRGY